MGVTPLNSLDAFNLKPEGEYQFRITPRNRYGWGEPVQSEFITVGKHCELPEFVRILPGQIKALLKSDIALECEARGDPVPSIRWFRDTVEIFAENDERYDVIYKGGLCILNIRNLKEEDTGRYMCEATNKIGRVSTFARLFVVVDPKILEASKHLSA